MAYKTKESVKRNLKKQWELACNYYMVELCNMWELDSSNGFWVSDDIGGLYCYGDNITLSINDIRYCVENDISYDEYCEWHEYMTWAIEFNQTIPNLSSWHSGCPRVDKATQEKLSSMKMELDKLIQETKDKF